jgi:hypothetical protein
LNISVGLKNIMDVQNVNAAMNNSIHSGNNNGTMMVGTGRSTFVKLNYKF